MLNILFEYCQTKLRHANPYTFALRYGVIYIKLLFEHCQPKLRHVQRIVNGNAQKVILCNFSPKKRVPY
jgi:hypothetical protein